MSCDVMIPSLTKLLITKRRLSALDAIAHDPHPVINIVFKIFELYVVAKEIQTLVKFRQCE